jgi:hypothetical protein
MLRSGQPAKAGYSVSVSAAAIRRAAPEASACVRNSAISSSIDNFFRFVDRVYVFRHVPRLVHEAHGRASREQEIEVVSRVRVDGNTVYAVLYARVACDAWHGGRPFRVRLKRDSPRGIALQTDTKGAAAMPSIARDTGIKDSIHGISVNANAGYDFYLLLTGGASMCLVHEARDMTKDIDAIYEPKEIVNRRADCGVADARRRLGRGPADCRRRNGNGIAGFCRLAGP